jgi:predicted MFS family arabinose efflux permease
MPGRHAAGGPPGDVSTSPAVDGTDSVSFTSLFRNRKFAVLYLAATQSQFGDQLARVALSVLVYSRTGSGLLTATTYALTFLPAFVGGLVLAGLADTRPRRGLLALCDLLRAGLFALMAIPSAPLWLVASLLVIAVLVGSPYNAGEPALVADLFTGPRYEAAVGLRTATSQAMQLLGFGFGGVIVAVTGANTALLVDAITFAVAAVLIRTGLPAFPPAAPRSGSGLQIRTGARTIARRPVLRILLGFAWLTAFWVVPEGLAAPYASAHGSGAFAVGMLLAANPVGNLVGTVALTRWVRPAARPRLLGWSAVAAGVPLLACAAGPPIWAAFALWAVSGVFSSYLVIVIAEFVVRVPATVRGQAIGLAGSSLLAAQGIGLLIGGALAGRWGTDLAIGIAGLAGSLAAVGLVMARRRAAGEPATNPADEPAREPGTGPGTGRDTDSCPEPTDKPTTEPAAAGRGELT